MERLLSLPLPKTDGSGENWSIWTEVPGRVCKVLQ